MDNNFAPFSVISKFTSSRSLQCFFSYWKLVFPKNVEISCFEGALLDYGAESSKLSIEGIVIYSNPEKDFLIERTMLFHTQN